MKFNNHASKGKIYLFFLCLFLWIVTIALNWPGHYSVDSMMQLIEGMTGQYVTFNPPLMAQILAFMTRLGGHGLFIVINSSLFLISILIVIMRAKKLSLKYVAIALLFIFLNPVTFIYNGTVWKDVFSANISVLAILIALYGSKKHFSFSLIAIILATASISIRPQAIVVFPLLCLLIPYQFEFRSNVLLKRIIFGAALTIFGYLSHTTINAIVDSNQSGLKVDSTMTGFSVAARFDTAGMIYYSKFPEVALDKFFENTDEIILAVKSSYSPERVDTLDPYRKAANGFDGVDIFKLWLELAKNEPTALLTHKLDAAQELFGTRMAGQCLPAHLGVANDTVKIAHNLGIQYIFPDGFIPRESNYKSFLFDFMKMGLVFFTGWLWISVCIFLAISSVINKSPLLFCLGISGLGYSMLFLLIGVACDFRYQYFTVVCALVGGLIFLVDRRKNTEL